MIQFMKLKNVDCVLDEMSIIDTSDGVYSHHFEQWGLVSRVTKKYIGFVTFEECLPEVTTKGEDYDMLVTINPIHNDKIQGFDHLSERHSRVELLNKAIDFVQNI